MKTSALNLLFVVILSAILFSCSKEDDGIYYNENSEAFNKAATYSVIDLEIMTLVNEYRQSKGLNTLSKLDVISNVAEGHTSYMVETGAVNHNNFNERAQNLMDNAGAKSVGENVAYGYNTAQGVVNGWLNSETHRKIIESTSYTHFGISTESDAEGRNYFTQMFIKK